MWVLQEVILGLSVTLHWGSRTISLDQLLDAHQNIITELHTRISREPGPGMASGAASMIDSSFTTAITKIKQLSLLRHS